MDTQNELHTYMHTYIQTNTHTHTHRGEKWVATKWIHEKKYQVPVKDGAATGAPVSAAKVASNVVV
jgi:hypothetical protein